MIKHREQTRKEWKWRVNNQKKPDWPLQSGDRQDSGLIDCMHVLIGWFVGCGAGEYRLYDFDL